MMVPFGLKPSHGHRRLAGRRGAVLVAWVAVIAFILFQISVSMMPMLAVAAPVADHADPCQSMMMDGTPMDMEDARTPARDADHRDKVTCPLMKVGGCFAMCATVLPLPPTVPSAERTALTLQVVETEGASLVVRPPQRPPRRT
jgi:hypothetical protein